ncbi:unnamed protein product [Lactuca saligna]|uniref:Uncharacterized protein n=1 Tax=Lactuca saligna TaxID=75948 RepID=A0AA35XZI4_LACSI|nr:unnamed protein product [Lactuca saligna]
MLYLTYNPNHHESDNLCTGITSYPLIEENGDQIDYPISPSDDAINHMVCYINEYISNAIFLNIEKNLEPPDSPQVTYSRVVDEDLLMIMKYFSLRQGPLSLMENNQTANMGLLVRNAY